MIYRYLTFRVRYEVLSPMRIGAGKINKLGSPVDLPVSIIKIEDREYPYIPGSSIKGVFRLYSEIICKSLGLDNKICDGGFGCTSKHNKALMNFMNDNNFEGIINLLKDEYCLICKLYGSGSYMSHILFSDAYPENDVSTGIKVGIAIDRRSGKVGMGPYKVEYIYPGSKFIGDITLINIPNYLVGLLANVIELINSGLVRFGGMKSRGFGRVKLSLIDLSGYVVNRRLEKISGRTTLVSLDEYDKEMEIDPKNLWEYFRNCMRLWDEYVRKKS